MSETTEAPAGLPEDDQPHGEPVNRSETSSPPPDEGKEPEPKAEAKPEGDAKPEKTEDEPKKPREDWRETRIRQQSARIAAEARRADDLARRLAEYEARENPKPQLQQDQQAQPTDPAEFKRAVAEEATRIAEQKAFDAECNKVAEAGSKDYGDGFLPALKTLWEATDGLDAKGAFTPRGLAMIDAAMETEKPHAVLHYLGQNPDEAIRIANLRSDAKRGAAIAKVAAELAQPAPTPPVSRAPAPLEPVSGAVRAEGNVYSEKMPISEYMKRRETELAARTKR